MYSTRHMGEERVEATDEYNHPQFVCSAFNSGVQ